MAGTGLTWNDEQTQQQLGGMTRRLANMTQVMRVAAEIMRSSVVRNFEVGGRPQRWAPLKPGTLARRKSSGGPLVVSGMGGGLMGSVSAWSGRIRARVFTDKIYGAIHQFGAAKGQFGRIMSILPGGGSRSMNVPWGSIPARPFMVLQEEDATEIREVLRDFVVGRGEG